jgi:hypothetical protein
VADETDPNTEQARWIDKQGDVWTLGSDGLLHTPETAPFTFERVQKKWGPLKRYPEANHAE